MGFDIRIKEYTVIKASLLAPNPKNYRVHPSRQALALRKVLENVGYADAIKVVENHGEDKEKYPYKIIDGHLRTGLAEDSDVPVLILDLNEEESDVVTATFDPIGTMAKTNTEILQSITKEMTDKNQELVSNVLADSHFWVGAFNWKLEEAVEKAADGVSYKPKSKVEGDDTSDEPQEELSPLEGKVQESLKSRMGEDLKGKLESRRQQRYTVALDLEYADKQIFEQAVKLSGLEKSTFALEASKEFLLGHWLVSGNTEIDSLGYAGEVVEETMEDTVEVIEDGA